MKIELWTDGACRGNGRDINATAGIGCVLLIPNREPIYLKEKLEFQPNTNNKAEIYAIIKGLNLLLKYYYLEDKFDKDDLVIFSDSNYTIQGITNWINGWRANGWVTAAKTPVKNKDLWMRLDELLNSLEKYLTITFIKVAGHAGVKWNEKCDQLANSAIDNL